MFHALRLFLLAALLTGNATAQQLPQPTSLPLSTPIHAGTFHVATGQFVPFVPGQQGLAGAADVVFNSNYPSGIFYDLDDGTVIFDEGRVPSTTSPDVVGTANSYRITGIQIAYATDSNTPVSLRLRLWHSYVACTDPSTLPTPIADITLLDLPGTSMAGAFTPYTVDIDMTQREFCLLADGDGSYNEGGVAGDCFGFALEVLDGGDGTGTGPIVGLRPGPLAPTGDGTVFQNPGAPAGSGLGAVDQWYDIRSASGSPFGLTAGLPGSWIDISPAGTGTGIALDLGDDGEATVTMTGGNSVFGAGPVRIGANGGLRFAGEGQELGGTNSALPQPSDTAASGCFGGSQALLAYWDDLLTSTGSGGTDGNVYLEELGGTLIVQWDDVTFPGTGGLERVTFQVQIPSTGPALAQLLYQDVLDPLPNGGASATIGYQAGGIGTDQQFSFDTPSAVGDGTVLSLVAPTPGQAICTNFGGYNPSTNVPAFGSFWLVLESDLNVDCAGCGEHIDDALEPNDDCASAAAVGVPSVVTNLVVDNLDDDYYAFTVPANTSLRAEVGFVHEQADINLELLAEDCVTVLDSSAGAAHVEQVEHFNCGVVPVVVVLRVFELGQDACGDYTLTTMLDAACASDDLLEDNDDCGEAFPLSLGFTPNLRIKPCDEDYYSLDADHGETLNLGLFFSHAVADLDLHLYAAGASCGTPAGILTSSISSTNDEFISWTNSTGQARNYVLFVDWFAAGSANCSVYQLAYTREPSTEIGFQYCSAVLNSTNRGAHIFATGSDVVANNDVTLGCKFLPNDSNGYFLNSLTNFFLPRPGGSIGNLCVGGTAVGRFNANVLNTGPTGGQVGLPINLTMLPRPMGPTAVMPGQTWYFQFWYRDVVGTVAVSNMSDAVGIRFL
jgi:hypothetical protein